MHDEYQDHIRLPLLRERVTSAAAAAEWIQDGMTIGMSGFTRAGDAKVVPLALAERARHENLKITLMTGASLGNDVDKTLTEAEQRGGHTPHVLEKAFSWHTRYRDTGSMLPPKENPAISALDYQVAK